ncbi:MULTISPECIES: two-component system response regulator ArcA [unclassified Thalassotalea]|uniref:two-component system response regulator ArcA n=1 Tax=unclassified Thalassotalea TaxID=2614972 RepID=UPI00107FED6F|nr:MULTISPECIES: two-component system response regulator ArcA [unclassified Thalassotalea]NMP15927.1 two-component system response regulator ArcA [Thalassotalea sp. Y01]QBY04954.1 two-component system response regulator ArcA [Thalassotalea sp. HSM 43]
MINQPQAKVLIVEDEEVTRLNLKNLFEAEGYLTYVAANGEEMERQLQDRNIDLVLMDINLPGKNGLLLAREIIEKDDKGLIFISGRDSDVDKVLGLEIGADDYITKPFNPRELTIRVRNLLKRISQVEKAAPMAATELIHFDNWQLDPNSRQMTSPNGITFPIPRGEYRALRLLMANRGKIVTRQALIQEMTGRDLRENDRTVDVTIRRLRKHFESDDASPEFINTIHGEGYRFIGNIEL